MPFINTKTTVEISAEKADSIKSKFGKAISLIGKSESWLMVNFEEKCRLYFKGDNSQALLLWKLLFLAKPMTASMMRLQKSLPTLFQVNSVLTRRAFI